MKSLRETEAEIESLKEFAEERYEEDYAKASQDHTIYVNCVYCGVRTKFGLVDIQPLTLVGFRYLIASLILLPRALCKGEIRNISGDAWWKLGVLGFLGYTVAQELQCARASR